jgi:hypothetical protein
MPQAFRNFDSDDAAVDEREPGPEFELGGEKFRCLPEAPSGVLAALAMAASVDQRGAVTFNQPNLIGFMEGVLVERLWRADPELPAGGEWEPADDVQRFRALLSSKSTIIKIETLGELMMWLSEVYTGRPT